MEGTAECLFNQMLIWVQLQRDFSDGIEVPNQLTLKYGVVWVGLTQSSETSKSRELSPAGSRRGIQRNLKHKGSLDIPLLALKI